MKLPNSPYMAPMTMLHYLQGRGYTPESQSPEGSPRCCVVALNQHISSILKDFLSMVFFMGAVQSPFLIVAGVITGYNHAKY